MSKSEMLRARIEPELKHDAEEILKSLGLSSSKAIGLFYKQIIFNHGLPFDLKIPNEKTQDAMLDVIMNKKLKKFSSIEEFKKKYS